VGIVIMTKNWEGVGIVIITNFWIQLFFNLSRNRWSCQCSLKKFLGRHLLSKCKQFTIVYYICIELLALFSRIERHVQNLDSRLDWPQKIWMTTMSKL
jgi:hypothetical protein